MNYKLFQMLAVFLLVSLCQSSQMLKHGLRFIDLIRHVSENFESYSKIKYPDQFQQLENKMKSLQKMEEVSLGLSICSQSVRSKCNKYAKNLINECNHSDTQYCLKQLTFVYPKCLRCYCNQATVGACRATNVVLYQAWKISERQGCDNILQKQCAPLVLADFLMLQTCQSCMCRASKKGYESYIPCNKTQQPEESLLQKVVG